MSGYKNELQSKLELNLILIAKFKPKLQFNLRAVCNWNQRKIVTDESNFFLHTNSLLWQKHFLMKLFAFWSQWVDVKSKARTLKSFQKWWETQVTTPQFSLFLPSSVLISASAGLTWSLPLSDIRSSMYQSNAFHNLCKCS